MVYKRLAVLVLLTLFIAGGFAFAASTGVIGDVFKYAWSNQIGWINFAPKDSNGNYVGLTITNSGITGYAWSPTFGWINFSPTGGGVSNTASGTLSGYAFGENTGWINFSGVTISCQGAFSGSATGTTVGTVNFDCTNCQVITNWSPVQGCGTHNECSNNQCVSVNGVGVDQCQTNANCSTDKHNVCNQQGQCTVVNGAGNDACQTDNDCGIITPQESHYECNDQKQCVVVVGVGDDQCQNNTDCGAPPTIDEIIKDKAKDITAPVVENIKVVAEGIKNVVKTPEGLLTTRVVATTGVAITATATAVTTLVATGSVFIPSALDIALNLIRLWGIVLTGFGIKKKIKYWGTAYDSVTKQPLDPVQIILTDPKGNEAAIAITDIDGRYGFLVAPGIYKMSAKKTNYAFPSEKLLNKFQDEMYNNLYFGEEIEIKNVGDVITKNIPLDPVKFDWNEFAKKNKTFMKFYSNWDVFIRKVIDVSYIVGFIVAIVGFLVVPQPYNSIILGIYLVLLLLRILGLKPKSFGYIIDKTTGVPLSFAILRVVIPNTNVEVAHKVADAYGRYFCLVPKGQYQVKIEKKNLDESYSPVYTSGVINVSKKGIIKQKFKIESNSQPPMNPTSTNLKPITPVPSMPPQKITPTPKNGDEKLDIDPSLLIHQLKSPLSSIKLSTEMFMDGNFGKITKEQKEIIEKIHQKTEALMTLVNDLSDIAKIKQKFSTFNCAPVDIEELIWDLSSLKKEDIDSKKITFKVNEIDLPQIQADKEKVSIAFENILDNAIKYNKVGGTIDVSFENKKDSLVIKFKDSGIGIPAPEIGSIFGKFFRATNAREIDQFGSGLGLFIAKNIIDNHQGKIWFESEQNKQTTFFIELPKAGPQKK